MESDTSASSKSSTRGSQLRLKAIYVGSPEHKFVPGIPARDLSEVEVLMYGADNLRVSQCYQLVEVEPPPEDEEETEELDDGC